MHFIKMITSDNETRWINLDQVSRVTLTEDAGSMLLVLMFADGDPENCLKIRGSDKVNRVAIDTLTLALNELSKTFEAEL